MKFITSRFDIHSLVKILAAALLAASIGAFISGCEQKGPAQEAGESIDDAVEEAGDKLEDAKDKAGDKVEEWKKDAEKNNNS
ncbi:MAG TPA: hypothetical protein VK036_03270 [Wenzhouxiangella sp.]|nr:hypothetical protein [Wenzhouxiangella sp.]